MVNKNNIDFSKGPMWKCIISQAIPLTIAQLVQLLYNVVDRIYIGHMDGGSSIALTGVGITFPVITIVMAFTALFGNGGVPLFAIARGGGDEREAEKILGNSFALLIGSAVVVMAICYIFCKPILFLFGASESSYVYAKKYLDIYLLGTILSMIGTGLNGYINAQGFPKVGMYTTVIGAFINIILDPIFIFGLDMGVAGAALATIISQACSAAWVLHFLTEKKALIRLKRKSIGIDGEITKNILRLGTANFIMHVTNCIVQIACNSTLQNFGGDIYVGIMTVINSIREIFILPINGIVNGAQPIISFNYGAGDYQRVKAGIRFNTFIGGGYTLFAWFAVVIMPGFWFSIFSKDVQLLELGVNALKVYFFGFVFMALQFAGQSTFQALGDAKHAITFSLLRKVVIVVPLALFLPYLGFGVMGVFWAEPISNMIGGLACYITMRRTVYRRL